MQHNLSLDFILNNYIMMVREADDGHGKVALSLMALLQERFRQLQKMKELRQEKELLRTLSGTEKQVAVPPPPTKQHYCYYYNRETTFNNIPRQPSCQLSLSLWPESSPDERADPPPNTSKSRPGSSCTSPVDTGSSGASDVDTSLRL